MNKENLYIQKSIKENYDKLFGEKIPPVMCDHIFEMLDKAMTLRVDNNLTTVVSIDNGVQTIIQYEEKESHIYVIDIMDTQTYNDKIKKGQ